MAKEDIKEIRAIQKEITQSVQDRGKALEKEGRNLNKIIDSLSKQAELGNRTLAETKDLAKSLASNAKIGNDINKLTEKRSKLTKSISFNRKQMLKGHIKISSLINRDLRIEQKQLKSQIRRAKLQAKVTELQTKAKDAFKKQILQGALFVTIFTGLWKIATGFAAKIDDIGKTFGVMAADDKFVKNLTDAEFSAIGIGLGLEDVVSTVQTLSSEFGISTGEAAALSATVLDTAKATGMSVDESTRLFGSLKSIAGLSNEQAEHLAESTFQLAKQRGVAPSAVMKDIAASSETIADFTDASGENIAEAAVQARQLGVSLDTTAKVAKGLLDFQSSLSAEIEASMLIGRQLNFQKARELALNNDISGAMEEVISQLGSEEEFNSMNVIQREALAKSIGVSTSELAKFVKGTKDLSVSGALASGEFENLVGQDAISGISRMMNKFKQLGAAIMNTLGPTFNKVAIIMSDWVGDSGDLTEVLSEKFTAFGEKITAFFTDVFTPATEGQLSTWEKIGQAINNIGPFFDNIKSAVNQLLPVLVTLKIASMGVALASAAATVMTAGAASMGLGIGIALATVAGAWLAVRALPTFQTLAPGQQATPTAGSAAMAHGQGQHGAETILHTNDIVKAIKNLENRMDSYFGTTGTVPNKIGSAVARNITSNAQHA